MPLTVSGSSDVDDAVQRLIQAGAEKVSLNSAAVKRQVRWEIGQKRFGRCASAQGLDANRVKGRRRARVVG